MPFFYWKGCVLWQWPMFMTSMGLHKTHSDCQSFFFSFFLHSRCGWILQWCCVSGSQSPPCHFILVKLSQYLTFTENSVFYFKHPKQQDHLSCETSGWRFWRESRKISCVRSYCSCGCHQVSAFEGTEGCKMSELRANQWPQRHLGFCHNHLPPLGNSASCLFFFLIADIMPTLLELLEKSYVDRTLTMLISYKKEKWYY